MRVHALICISDFFNMWSGAIINKRTLDHRTNVSLWHKQAWLWRERGQPPAPGKRVRFPPPGSPSRRCLFISNSSPSFVVRVNILALIASTFARIGFRVNRRFR